MNNEVTFKAQVFPLLSVFRDPNILSKIFRFSPRLSLISATLDPNTSVITFITQLTNDIPQNANVTVEYVPTNSEDPHFDCATPMTTVFENVHFAKHLLFYYSPLSLGVAKAAHFISFVTLPLGAIALVMGLLFRKVGGLEMAAVLQFCFLSALWFNEYLHVQLESLWTLKFAFGFNFPFFAENDVPFSLSAPFTPQMRMSKLFGNVHNLMALLQIIPIVCFVVNFLRMKLFMKKMEKENIGTFEQQPKP